QFFFSSGRRHTRWPRDWSSDVCSSDLMAGGAWRWAAALIFCGGDRRWLEVGGGRWLGRRRRKLPSGGNGSVRARAKRRRGIEQRSEERRVGKWGRSGGGGWRAVRKREG